MILFTANAEGASGNKPLTTADLRRSAGFSTYELRPEHVKRVDAKDSPYCADADCPATQNNKPDSAE